MNSFEEIPLEDQITVYKTEDGQMAVEKKCLNCKNRVKFKGNGWSVFVCQLPYVNKAASEITFHMVDKNETCELFDPKKKE